MNHVYVVDCGSVRGYQLLVHFLQDYIIVSDKCYITAQKKMMSNSCFYLILKSDPCIYNIL